MEHDAEEWSNSNIASLNVCNHLQNVEKGCLGRKVLRKLHFIH